MIMKRYKVSVITREGMFSFFMPGWYCKPSILESVVFYLHSIHEDGFIKYVTCQRYPSKVLICKNHPEYTVYSLHHVESVDGLQFTVPVFK